MTPYSSLRPQLLAGGSRCADLLAVARATAREHARLNAFRELFDDAEQRAMDVDASIAAGGAGPLAGMLVAVKDNFCVAGHDTGCASRILEGFRAQYDATVVRRILDAGAILVGRTNMDEFAMGSSNENSAYGPVLHPLDATRVPGGSSGGSAVAVAAGIVHAALGSDTGGSVRQPASFTGIVGFKPTYGRLSRYGLVAFASSLDTVGFFAAGMEDAARMYAVMAGHDPLDATSAPRAVEDPLPPLSRGVAGLRIGIPEEYVPGSLDPEIRAALDRAAEAFRAGGASVRRVSLPHAKYTIPVYTIIAMAEASSNLSRYDGVRYGHRAAGGVMAATRSEGFGPEVKRRVMLGTYALSAGYYDAYYRKAQRVRRLISEDFTRAFEDVDVLLTLTAPGTAFSLGEKIDDPLQMYLSDTFTASANLAGIPGVSVPAGTDARGLPIGVQLLARHFDEGGLFAAGAFLEAARR
ncbi:MAG: Asp-tRNA(Asn)/Glu-tRNA(Gln) amidotransferase subunit GatA [Ignavibacteria bacterium]|nr:Asp-tRNA(Asn)/Glu-tRNA(Gln) amidotransferase subunit GatA [Ignavibacteria bacterium]